MIANCLACNSTQIVVRSKRAGIVVLECKHCELQFSETNEEVVISTDKEFYHGIDLSYDDQLDLARQILPGRIAAYEKLLGRPLRTIIEVGCATGAYARAYDELGVAYTGVEIEGNIAQKACERTQMNIVHANFMDISFSENFDVFFCSQVLEHVPAPALFISRAASLCRDGLVHVDVPNHGGLTSQIRKIYHRTDYGFIQPPHHMIAYNRTALTKLYEHCGLEEIQCSALPNDDPIWGQLVVAPSDSRRIMYRVSGMLNAGSLLFAIGKPRQVAQCENGQ